MGTGLMSSALLVVLGTAAFMPVTCGIANVTRLREMLTTHFSKPRNHVTNPGYKTAAMNFIQNQFSDMGLQVLLHTFSTELNNVTGTNVIGLLQGRFFNTSKDHVMAIGAHYDTMRNTPGVDDNGAAVVVMLEAARALSQNKQRNNTLLFIAFDFEESEYGQSQVACSSGLCGSRALTEQWLPDFLTSTLTWGGIYVMDTIMNFNETPASQNFDEQLGQVFPKQLNDVESDGRQGDFLVITGRKTDQVLVDSFSSQWDERGQTQYEIEQFILPGISNVFSDFLRSDHTSFWLKNLSAVFITDTADFRGYMSQCYHHECDSLSQVTEAMLGFAAKTCDTLVAIMTEGPTSTSSFHQGNRAVLASFLMTAVLLLLRPAF